MHRSEDRRIAESVDELVFFCKPSFVFNFLMESEIYRLNDEAVIEGSRDKLSEALCILDESKLEISTDQVAELFSLTSLNLSRLSDSDTALQLLDQVIELGRSPTILASAHLEICYRDPSRLQTHATAALRIAEEALISLENVSLAPKLTSLLSQACALLKMGGVASVVSRSLTDDNLRSALDHRKSHAAGIIQKWFKRLRGHRLIVHVCRKFLIDARLTRAATRLQSFIRGWRIRKRIKRGPVVKRKIAWSGGRLQLIEFRPLSYG